MTFETITTPDTNFPATLFELDKDTTDALMDLFDFEEEAQRKDEYNCLPLGCCDYSFYSIDSFFTLESDIDI